MRILSKSFVATLCLAVASLPASAGFFGPTKNILSGDELTKKLHSQAVVVDVSGGSLDVRSKAAAVSGFVLGFVLSSAMASGGGMGGVANAQQLQQNLQAKSQIAASFNKEFKVAFANIAANQAAKPNSQVAKEGPLSLVTQQVVASLAQTPAIKLQALDAGQNPGAADLQLRIVQNSWLLDFSMVSSDYTLSHDIEVSLYQKQGDTLFFTQACKGPHSEKMNKENWEKDNFAAVAKASVDMGNQCAEKIIAALGLTPAREARKPAEIPVSAPTLNLSNEPLHGSAPAIETVSSVRVPEVATIHSPTATGLTTEPSPPVTPR